MTYQLSVESKGKSSSLNLGTKCAAYLDAFAVELVLQSC